MKPEVSTGYQLGHEVWNRESDSIPGDILRVAPSTQFRQWGILLQDMHTQCFQFSY